jgi:virulence-associated protein VapD
MAAFMPPPVPALLANLPAPAWGISYDIRTRETEDDLPQEWNADRGQSFSIIGRFDSHYTCSVNTHVRLRAILNGWNFFRDQYSDYINPNTTAITTWLAMMSLESIQPPPKFSSTVRRIRMQRHDMLNIMDVSASL